MYEIPDILWDKIVPFLLPPPKRKKTGRPRMNNRKAMNAIFYVLRTGCQWNALPRSLGASRPKQHMCMDKGYDYPKVYELLEDYGYTIHISSRGEESRINSKQIPRYRAKRWVVEEPTPG